MRIGRRWWVLATGAVSALGLVLLAVTLVPGATPVPEQPVTAGPVPPRHQGMDLADLGRASGQPQPTGSDVPPPMPLPIMSSEPLSAALFQQQVADAKPCQAGPADPPIAEPASSTFVMPLIRGQPGAKICISQPVPTVRQGPGLD